MLSTLSYSPNGGNIGNIWNRPHGAGDSGPRSSGNNGNNGNNGNKHASQKQPGGGRTRVLAAHHPPLSTGLV